MSNMGADGGDANLKVGIDMDSESVKAFLAALERTMLQGMGKIFADMQKTLGAFGTTARKQMHDVERATRGVAHAAEDLGDAFDHSLHETSKESIKLFSVLNKLEASISTINSAILATRTQTRQEMIRGTAEINNASRESINTARNASKERMVLMQQETALASAAAKHRTAIAQQMWAQIGRIEKAGGVAISGVARTTVAAISKTFSGLGHLFRRNNQEITNGLSSSLRSRESAMKQSFTRQERDLRASVSRQSQQIQQLNKQMNEGVLGFANRRNLFAGAVGAVGAAGFFRSTFMMGSQFTQGLAVLQAQLDLTAEEMKGVRDLSIQLGNDISLPGVSALDAAQAINLLAKQFGALGEGALTAAENAAKGTLQLARAANVSAEDAAQVVGAAVNVFGISADQATMVADQVTGALTQAAGVSFQDFADSFRQAAGVFAMFQKPAVGATEALVGFNTALAVIARSGYTGSDAGTSLKQFFLQGTRDADDAKAALAEVTARAGETGTAFYDAAGSARPLEETLDILRRGLEGYTDEQRNAALQTIFGSDAVKVANALLSVSSEEYAKITDRIRKEGLAAKIATAQNQGLKGALDAALSVFQTVQIMLYEKFNVALGNIVLSLTELANTILFGTGPALTVLRNGLMGAAAGMMAVIAAKGAIEVFKLLGVAMKMAISPFGAFIIAAAAIGGILGMMLSRSEDLRETFGLLGARFIELGTQIGTLLAPLFESLGNFIDDTLIPAIDSLAQFLADNLIKAFDATVTFITDTAIPAIKDFVTAVVEGAKAAYDAFIVFATEGALGSFLDWVRSAAAAIGALIAPAVEGLKELGAALGDALGGNFSNLGSGLQALASGIVESVVNIAEAIGRALQPIAERVVAFFKDLFSPQSIKKMISGLLQIVEQIGFILGKIVSDPRLYKVAAAVGAAAVVVGIRFVEGFIRGVIDNADEIVDALKGVFKAVFKAVFANPALIIGGFVAASLGQRLFSVFSVAGKDGAKGLATGFLGGLKSLPTMLTGSLDNVWLSLRKQQDKEFQSLVNKKRMYGINTPMYNVDPNGTVRNQFQKVKWEVRAFEQQLTAAQIRALQFRDTMNNLKTTLPTVFRGLGSAFVGSFSAAFKTFEGLFSGGRMMASGKNLANMLFSPSNMAGYVSAGNAGGVRFRDAFVAAWKPVTAKLGESWAAMKELAAKQGTTVGKIMGASIANAGTVVLSAWIGGTLAGGNGMMAALTAGITGWAMTGNPLVGAASAGVSLLATAFTKASNAAKKFKAEVAQLAESIGSQLLDALKQGKILLSDLANLSIGDLAPDALEGIVTGAVKALDATQQKLLTAIESQTGFRVGEVFDMAWEQAGEDADKFGEIVNDAFLRAAASSADFTKRFGAYADEVSAILLQIAEPGGANGIWDFIMDEEVWANVPEDLKEVIRLNDIYLDSLLDVGVALDEQGRKSAASFADAKVEVEALARELDLGVTPAAGEVERAWSNMYTSGMSLADVNAEFDRLGLEAPDTSGWEHAMDQAKAKVDVLTAAVDAAKDATDTLFNPYSSTFQAATDALILSVIDIGEELDGIIETSDLSDPAEIREALEPLSTIVGDVVLAGVKDGLSPDQIKTELEAARANLLAALGPPDPTNPSYVAAAEAINTTFDNALNGLGITIDQIQTTEEAAASAAAIQEYLNTHPFSTVIEAEWALMTPEEEDQLRMDAAGRQALINGGPPKPSEAEGNEYVSAWASIFQNANDAAAAAIADPEGKIASSADGAAQSAIDAAETTLETKSPSRVFNRIGRFITAGLANGIRAGKSGVVSAIIGTVRAAINAAESELEIKSPSKVFREIGEQIGAGLAIGINASADDAVAAVNQMVDDMVDAMNGGALSSAASALFDSLTGSDSPFAAPQTASIAQITQATQGFLSTISGTAQQAWTINATPFAQLTAEQQNIFGESAFSLNPADVLGAQNLNALQGAFDAIADYGEQLLASGMAADEVTKIMEAQVDALVALAVQYGFNQDQVLAIADALGLSDEALQDFLDSLDEINTTPDPARLPDLSGGGNAGPGATMRLDASGWNIYLPTGDPDAAALAVLNKLSRVL